MAQLEIFGSTLQKTGEWIRDIRDALGWDADERAYVALRAVLHTLRDRLPTIEAVHLGAQLPTLIRGMYYESWTPVDKPLKFTRDQFLMCIATYFPNEPELEIIPIVRAVLDVMTARMDAGALQKVERILPREFADFWPALRAG